MEQFIVEHAHLAHFVIFGLFMLAGCHLPISEDVLVILGGVLASTIVPENSWKIYTAIFLGAYISDFFVYGTGRLLGPSLSSHRFFSKLFKKKRIEKLQAHYEEWGMLTLFFGRFIPFGVRNCLFVTAGMGRMPLLKFAFVDGFACMISTSSLFMLSYFCGKSCSLWVKLANISIFALFLVALFIFIWYKSTRKTEIE